MPCDEYAYDSDLDAPSLQERGDILIRRAADGSNPSLLIILQPSYDFLAAKKCHLNHRRTLVLDTRRLQSVFCLRKKHDEVLEKIPRGHDTVELRRCIREYLIDPLLADESAPLVVSLAQSLRSCAGVGETYWVNPFAEGIRKVLLNDMCVTVSCRDGYVTSREEFFLRWPQFLVGLPEEARKVVEADFERGGYLCPWCFGYDALREDLRLFLAGAEVAESGVWRKRRGLVREVRERLDRLERQRRVLGYLNAWSVPFERDEGGDDDESDGEREMEYGYETDVEYFEEGMEGDLEDELMND